MHHLTIREAFVSLLGMKHDKKRYHDVGIIMAVKDIAKLLGLTSTPMLYNYANGITGSMEPERALALFKHFNILLKDYNSIEELENAVTSTEIGDQIAKEPTRQLVEELIKASQEPDDKLMRKAVLKIIGRYY